MSKYGDRALTALGKEPEPPPSILRFVANFTLPARTTRFILREKYIVNTGPGPHVKIGYVESAFTKALGDKIEEPSGEVRLRVDVLLRRSVFIPAIEELRRGGIITKVTPGEFFLALEQQPDGPKSSAGALLANGYANLVEMEVEPGVSLLVIACWSVSLGGWYVGAEPPARSDLWDAGNRLFSRNSRGDSVAQPSV